MHDTNTSAKEDSFAPAAMAKPPAPRLGELDVLRGLAAFAVMVFHYTIRYREVFAPGGPPAHGSPLGETAVHLFFMISGFVIFMTLSKTRTALDFIVSRFSRLYPVYWAAVLLTFTIITFAPLPGRTPGFAQLAVNLTMLQNWLRVPPVDGVYWTLAVELSFYVIMLAVFLTGWLRRIEWLVIPWLLLEGAWAFLGHRHDLPKIVEISFLLKYAHLFLAGMLFYRLRFDGPTPARHGLIACCLATQLLLRGPGGSSSPSPGLSQLLEGPVVGLLSIGFFAAFYALACDRLAWVAARPLAFLGAISYSLYLVHQNIGYVVMRALDPYPRPLQIAAAAAVAVLLASVLTFFIERPALRAIREAYKRRKLRSRAPVPAATPHPSSPQP